MEVKRLKLVDIVSAYSRETVFIKDKGLMFEFLLCRRGCQFKTWRNNETNKMKKLKLFFEDEEKNNKTIVDDVNKSRRFYHEIVCPYTHYEYDGEDYYLERSEGFYILYKVVPLLINDGEFDWKENAKYNSKEAIITRGMFEYQCIVNADGNGKVIVRYVKCENLHRNKVTIAEFDVPNAYNEVFLEEINRWNKEFKDSIAA